MEQTIELQIKGIRDEILGKIAEGAKLADLKALQRQVDALDQSVQGRSVGAPVSHANRLKDILGANASVQKLLETKRGNATIILRDEDARPFIEQKTTLLESGVGFATTGVMPIERSLGITAEARQRLTVRSVLTATPTSASLIDYVRVLTPLSIASPQTEGNDKGQNTVNFESRSEKVQTVATWMPASKQIMDDLNELASFLDSGLRYYVNLEEELQLLVGAGSGTDLNGLVTQSTAFNTALLSAAAGWNKIDIIGRAVQQITTAKEIQPTFVILHPADWWAMRLQKDGFGRYILGDPQTVVTPSLFGLQVVPTVSIASGTFLVGSGSSEAAEIRDRMELVVEISDSHSDYFVKNLLAVRAEKRLALIVRRAASFIHGTFTTSP